MEEQAPLRVETWHEQPVSPRPHQHRYKIMTGKGGTIRYCTRCGVSWILLVANDIMHLHQFDHAEWSEIKEDKRNE